MEPREGRRKVPHRVLYLDGVPKGEEFRAPRFLENRDQVNDLYEEVYSRQDPPDLCLDCRALRPSIFTMLLKFFEEYRGGLRVLATDPVPVAVLSRFVVVKKEVMVTEGSLVEVRLRGLSPQMKEKIGGLFGLHSREGE